MTADDDLVLGHILRAYLYLYATSTDGVSNARKVLEDMDGIADLGEREVLHLRAAHSWASGQWDDATHYLERALLHDSATSWLSRSLKTCTSFSDRAKTSWAS